MVFVLWTLIKHTTIRRRWLIKKINQMTHTYLRLGWFAPKALRRGSSMTPPPTPLFGWEHRRAHRLETKVFGRVQALSVNPNSGCKSRQPYLQKPSWKFSYNHDQHYPYLSCEIPCRFLVRWKRCWWLESKTTPTYTWSGGPWHSLSTNENLRSLREPWPNGVCVNLPGVSILSKMLQISQP